MADDSPQARALFASGLDGSNRRRLTFGPHRDTAPRLLDDGRIRFERTLAGSEAGPPLVLTIRPDGTGVARALELSFPPGPPAAGRPEPPLLTSVVNMARTTGTLLCLDVYASRLPSIAALPRGRIASVRVSAAASPEGPTLAEAPVHADGSFLVEVPADTLLALTLIGHDGAELASLRSGVWVRPNENRGCIGCHEEEDRAPANRRPLALRGRG